VEEAVELPEDYKIVVANSYVEAKKSAGAKNKFNQKVACYEFGFMMVKELFPQYKDKLKYLRDINTENLNISQDKIYEILLKLPQKLKPYELFGLLPYEYHERIKHIQKNHELPDYYEIRSVVLYGLAECERAKKCIGLLKNREYEALGKMMTISHNGDRVWNAKENIPYDYSASDEYLKKLIIDLHSDDEVTAASAQLWRQSGGYACSTKDIDELVDYILEQDGVLGAEISGAGLGGCIIILVKSDKTDNLLNKIKENYYDKNGLPMGVQAFVPVAGSLVL
jgi:N-acetylgalactosamine kinase